MCDEILVLWFTSFKICYSIILCSCLINYIHCICLRESNSFNEIQLTLVISNSMGPWKKFESTVVRLKRSYENTGSVVCLMTKGRQLERNFEELKRASHVPILGTILNIFDVFVAVFSLSVKFFESCGTTDINVFHHFSTPHL